MREPEILEQPSHPFRRIAAITGVVAVAAFALNEISNFGSDLFGHIKDGIPHREMQAQAGSALRQVGLPGKTILVEGEGTGSAEIDLELDSHGIPVASWAWNTFGAGFTQRRASATREGKVQIGSNKNAWTLSPYFNPSVDNPDKQWGIQATVNPDKLFLQRADMQYVPNSAGERVPQGNDAILVRFANLIGIDSGMAARIGNVTTISDEVFENTCGFELRDNIPAGVQNAVRAQVLGKEQLFQAKPDMRDDAEWLKKLAAQPVHVIFQRTRVDGHGQIRTQDITPSEIALPRNNVPTKQEIAATFHLSPKSVQLGSSGCYFTGPAIRQEEDILAQSASTTTPSGVASRG